MGRRRRRRWLHPSRARGHWGRRGAGHRAGISVRGLRTAGVGILTHGCCQHHAGARAAGARGERARGRGGPGTRALTGRGPRAQSRCPSRWRGEETRGAEREEAVPAAPPPPRRRRRAARSASRGLTERGRGAQGPGGRLPPGGSRSAAGGLSDAQAVRGALPAGSGRPPGREPGAPQRGDAPREEARRTPARGPPPRARRSREPRGLRAGPGLGERTLAWPLPSGCPERPHGGLAECSGLGVLRPGTGSLALAPHDPAGRTLGLSPWWGRFVSLGVNPDADFRGPQKQLVGPSWVSSFLSFLD